jgi:hypothetical protein
MRHLTKAAAVAVLAVAANASAFNIETVATPGCHERITAQAVARSGWPQGAVAPAPSASDSDLAANLQFHVPAGTDPWSLALLIGVRDNDLGGFSPTNLPEFAAVQNGDGEQHPHCLRELDDRGDGADASALSGCRAFMLGEVAAAIGDDDGVDLAATELHRVDLAFQDRQVPLARFPFHMGRAAHALEDSFAHTFRTADLHQVQSVLTYVAPDLGEGYDADLDGFPHQSAMDECDDESPEAKARAAAATQAVSELLEAVNAAPDRATRLARAGDALDAWLGRAPGCSENNDWCGHAARPAGCSAVGGAPAALLALLASILVRRRSRNVLTAVALTVAGAAHAADLGVETQAAPAPTEDSRRFSLHAALGASFDNPGANLTAGARWRLSRRLRVGLDVELSPWLDPISGRAALGTFDAYATAGILWGELGPLEVRTGLEAGTSVLLFRASGAHEGAVGVFGGLSLLQVSLVLTRSLRLELSPEIAVAVPELRGVPLAYRQYRVAIGFDWRL